jgi:hypothetical protein
MLLEVSTETLNKLKLTAHQFLIIKMLHDQRLDELREYLKCIKSDGTLGYDLSILYDRGFLNYDASNPEDFNIIKVSPLYSKLISEGTFFEELFDIFPRKIVRPNGTIDYLRTDRSTCNRLYTFYTLNNRSKHDHILKCLKLEIETRQKEGSLCYMKRMPSWLLSKEWESYADRIADSSGVQIESNKYGTDAE